MVGILLFGFVKQLAFFSGVVVVLDSLLSACLVAFWKKTCAVWWPFLVHGFIWWFMS